LIDAALYVGAKKENDQPPIAFWADHRLSSNAEGLRALRKIRLTNKSILPIIEDGFSIYYAPEIKAESNTWSPRPFASHLLLNNINSQHFSTVESIFDVRQGVITGKNNVFLISKNTWKNFPEPEQRYFRPAVINKSIKFGYLSDQVYVFYPNGDSFIETEEELKKKVQNYYNDVLIRNKDLLLERSRKNESNWWQLSEHRAWQEFSRPKIISTYFGGSGSFAWDSTGEFVVVQGYAWLFRPTGKLREINEDLGMAYLTILNSNLFSELLSAVSNHVGGGQWNLSKRFVKKIPLPNLTLPEIDPRLIATLADVGRQIFDGSPPNNNESEELVHTIYRI
jgi:adenine-specific DNA-methyltransferase